jgi:putative oxidoreductase
MTAFGLLVIRLAVGLTVGAHGAQKLFGWWGGPGMIGWTGVMKKMRVRPPGAWAWISALAELGGGLLLALGLLTPLGAAAIAGSMLVAIALVHWPNGFWNSKRGYEYNVVILGAVVGVALTGPGAYALDSALRLNAPEPATVVVLAVITLIGFAAALASRKPAAPVPGREPAQT